MKRLGLLMICVVFMTWGCSHSYNSMPVASVGVDMKGGANCEILGDTEATASVQIILGFIKLGDSSISGSFPASLTPLASGKTICEQAAAYKAIQNFEGADEILCPRFKTELTFSLGPVYEAYTSTVKAKAVKIR
ncbi:MAG: hypothetical protein SV775_13705 [Thermodesulfobacteriota bacterium]|nr:hypothetical protein [Thermodesulfobacteriota bacterium]